MRPSRFARVLLLAALASPAIGQLETRKFRAPYPYPPGPTAYNFFGSYIDVDGDTAVVAIRFRPAAQAIIFERANGEWGRAQELQIPSTGSAFSPVAMSGDSLLIMRKDAWNAADSVFAFERTGSTWVLVQELISTSIPGAELGASIDMQGERAVISVPNHGQQATFGGAVILYERVAGVWIETDFIESPMPTSRGHFGRSVALDEDLLVVAQPGSGVSYIPRYAFVYRRVGGAWNLEQRLEERQDTRYAASVDVDDQRVVVGDYLDEVPGSVRGAVFLYEFSGGQWVGTEVVRTSDPRVDPWFGSGVALDGPRLVVSSALALTGATSSGATVQVFSEGPTGFAPDGVVEGYGHTGHTSDSIFGGALAISGGELWVGAPGETDNYPFRKGAVYTYSLPVGTTHCGATPNSSGAAATIVGLGSSSVADGELTLRVAPVPDTTGWFFFGLHAQQVPFGNGFLCISGALSSLGTIRGQAGVLELDVDLASSPANVLVPGSTWSFQACFRDPAAGGADFNLSDATRIAFRP